MHEENLLYMIEYKCKVLYGVLVDIATQRN
jgi:hypothetical protein